MSFSTEAAVYDRRQSGSMTADDLVIATSSAVIFLRLRATALALRGPPLQFKQSFSKPYGPLL